MLAPTLQAGAAAVGRCLERALPVAALTAALRPRRQLVRVRAKVRVRVRVRFRG